MHSAITAYRLPLPVYPLAGACIVGGIIYRIQPRSTGEGIPSYIRGVQFQNGFFSFSETFFKFMAALMTLAFYGNGGIVGPLGHATSGTMSFITKRINHLFRLFDEDDTRTAAICGMAAALGAIFHSSIGSGMSAGFAGPTIIVGMLLGVAVSPMAGVATLSPTYYAFLAAGFAGMLSSAINVPLAAAVMATEFFGLQYSFPAGLAAILGFQVTRHITIYDYPAEPTS